MSAPKLGSLLAGGPAQLGISPFLLAYWVGSQEHFAAFFAAETALAKHYSRCARRRGCCLTPWQCRKLFVGQSMTGGPECVQVHCGHAELPRAAKPAEALRGSLPGEAGTSSPLMPRLSIYVSSQQLDGS